MGLSKTYTPKEWEDDVYAAWEKSGYFNPDNSPRAKKTFSIAMPPPNATGTLHLGHAMFLALQDLMTRQHRMVGDKTLWLPGTDHAAIGTHSKVEQLLAKEGLTRQEVGREAFLERIHEYVEHSRATIRKQIRKMGASCDWSRERYTLDEGLSHAVSEIFVRMYHDGLIYRDNRIVNWCPKCLSTLSDVEVEHIESDGQLYYIKYPIKDSATDFITVATTRPETMLGDTAIAVHPDDTRYKKLLSAIAIQPMGHHEIPIIADEYVDPSFGSGALKITPAHDLNDFALGKKYHLKTLNILTESGKINLKDLKGQSIDLKEISYLDSMDRLDAREAIVADLQKKGLLEKIEDLHHSLATCYKCDTVIEPFISLQWFVAVDKKIERYESSLKELMHESVSSKKIQFVPTRFEKTYFQWVDNLRDWCISRQIWFGHQLPVYYCEQSMGGCGETLVQTTQPESCPTCKKSVIRRDEDTLDTWFSSGLWTFSTLGWPENATEKHGKIERKGDLATFHPTSVLETGYDIIFFWVARMILMSRYALNEVPFHTVYLNGLVLDVHGKKMSKSREESIIDPLDMIEKYGTDALRLSLLVGVTPGNDIRLNEEKIESFRNFVNKLWNISRFILEFNAKDVSTEKHTALTLADQWIMSRLHKTIAKVNELISTFKFSQAAEELRTFTWDELADWYLEIAKIEKGKNHILNELLETLLSLWHPFTPFVTEVIYQELLASVYAGERTKHPKFLMVHPWPTVTEKYINEEVEQDFSTLRTMVQVIRNARAENNIAPGQKIQAIFFAPARADFIRQYEELLKSLARLDFITILEKGERPTSAIYLKVEDIEIYLPLGLMKIEEEKQRLQKELEKKQGLYDNLKTRIANEEFASRAPKHIIETEQQKLGEYLHSIEKIKEQLIKLS